ncbi:MAG: BspA family leucine-rich repeat surface protein [Mogibacterium sp.]|nr:BspA family leucine-rich repeat surface protein [Mogibacterium sp.]
MRERTFIKGSGIIALIVTLFIMLAAFAMLTSLKAHAEPLSGTYNGLDWEITDGGVLKLGKVKETQVLTNHEGAETGFVEDTYLELGPLDPSRDPRAESEATAARRAEWPWLANGRDIRINTVEVEGDIIARGSLRFIFSGMPNLTALKGLEKINTAEVTDMLGLFSYRIWDSSSESWNNVHSPKVTSMDGIFSWNVSKVRNMQEMFAGTAIKKADLSKWNTCDELYTISTMFGGCPALKSVKFGTGFNTGGVKSFDNLFIYCTSLEKIDGLQNLNTGNAISMQRMFQNCQALKSVDVSNFDTSNAKTIDRMFWGCVSLETADVSGFNTVNVQNMANLFNGCVKLDPIDVSGWSTGNVKNFGGMFGGAQSVKVLDVSRFDTSSATTLEGMFSGNNALEYLDLSNFDTSNVNNIKHMIRSTDGLKRIDGIGNLDLSNVEEGLAFLSRLRSIELINGLEKLDLSDIENIDEVFHSSHALMRPFQAILGSSTASDEDKAAAQAAIDAINIMAGHETKTADRLAAFEDLKAVYPLLYKQDSYKDTVEGLIEDARNAATEANRLEGEALTAKNLAAKAQQIADASMKAAEEVSKKNPGSAEAVLAAKKALDDAVEARTAAAEAKNAANLAASAANYAKVKAEDAKYAAEENGDADLKNAANSLADMEPAAQRTAAATAEAADNYDTAFDTKVAAEEAYSREKNKKGSEAATAADDAKKAITDAEAAIKAAEAEVAKDPSSAASDTAVDAAKKAAEAAAAKVEAAKKAIEELKAIADATGDSGLTAQADSLMSTLTNDIKPKSDTALEAAYKLAADQKLKKAEKLVNADPSTPEALKAAQEAVKATQDYYSFVSAKYGANSAQAVEAKKMLDAANELLKKVNEFGKEFEYAKNRYRIIKMPGETWDGEATLVLAKNAKKVNIPKEVKYEGKTYEVTRVEAKAFRAKKIRKVTLGANIEKLNKNAFKKSKATTVVVKTKYLTKKRVKGSFKGSKLKTVQVKVGSKKVNKKYVKKYKKIFTTANAGKKVTVK